MTFGHSRRAGNTPVVVSDTPSRGELLEFEKNTRHFGLDVRQSVTVATRDERGRSGEPRTRLGACGSPTTLGRPVLAGIAILLGLLKLWLVSSQPLMAIGGSGLDDELFLRLARAMLRGEWLGAYDAATLVKGSGYPLWIAFNSLLGLPLLLSQHLLYLGACGVFALALGPVVESWAMRLAIFALLAFSPQSYSVHALRVLREGNFYTALSLLVVACSIGLFLRCEDRLRSMLIWSAALGGCSSWFWITREEGLWLLPTMLLMLGLGAREIFRSGAQDRFRRLALLALPLLLLGATNALVATLNYQHYGSFTTIELKAAPFQRAYGALTRVEEMNPDPIRQVPVSRASRLQIYPLSPAFAELRPLLEGSLGRAMAHDSSLPEDHPRKGEIGGAWFQWALRAAASARGHHESAPRAAAYYERLAGEIDDACDRGALLCGDPRSSIFPPLRGEDLPVFLERLLVGAWTAVTFRGSEPGVGRSTGSPNAMSVFHNLTRNRLAPHSEDAPSMRPESAMDRARLWVLAMLFRLYALAGPFAAIAAFLSLAVGAVKRELPPRLAAAGAIALALLAAVTLRLLLLSFIATTSFDMNARYFAPLQPLLLAFDCLALWIASVLWSGGEVRATRIG